MSDAASVQPGGADGLVPFVPRLTIEWLREHPERRWIDRDGTLAFVDISGFTAMSESLSAYGKAGAEEVTEVMNDTFSTLLDHAYSYGGGLLKFGGDALLLFFDGDDHARRGVRAASGMRSALEEIGRPATSAGVVTLRMHVGIHTGRFHFFLVGGSHRELLVAGPETTRTVEMESASEAGEILLSPATAAALAPGEAGDAKGPGLLLARAPGAPRLLVPLPPVDGLDLDHAVPAPLRTQLLQVGRFEGEHRQVAIGFLRYSGFDALVAADPAAAADALDSLVSTVQDAADEHGVTFLETDIDRDGGRIVLVAGAPQTAGDDEVRLLRTVRRSIDARPPLALHVGASRGRVFTGQVGASFRRTYTVLGDTAALAARLMARAGTNEILAAEAVVERSGGRFDAARLEPFAVKGKAEPVQAYALGQILEERQEKAARIELPFVDRERERAVLGASVAPVRMGFGTLVELVGEPGLGKSRLAEELRLNCPDLAMVSTRCEQYETTTPYHPFRPLLRSLLSVELGDDPAANREALSTRVEEIDPDLTPWSPLLGAPLDAEVASTPEVDELEPAFRRARLHGLVGSLLAQLLDQPTLLLFEDVHWMDEASSDLLRHLGTQLSSRPWLACATRRPVAGGFSAAEGVPPLPALTLRLEPLPEADARKLVEAAAGDAALSEEELLAMTERGAGNPLFLQELAAVGGGTDGGGDLPETVEALLTARIDALAPGDRALLRWASVLGASFGSQDVAAVLQEDPAAASDAEVWDRLVEFVERDPEVPSGFRFRHGLIRDAAYEGLSFRRRRELHGRVAEMLEARHAGDVGEAAELLSLHFSRAGRAPETWRYSVDAGRHAQRNWANREAAEFFRRAIDSAADMPELPAPDLAAVWESLGDCLQLLSEFEDASLAFAAARKLGPAEGPEAVRLMYKEGLLREDWGRYSDAIRWYNRGLRAVETIGDERLRMRYRLDLQMGYAQARLRQGVFADCIDRCNEIVAEALEVDDMKSLAGAYLMLHVVKTMLGSPDRASFSGLALPLFEELGDLSGQAGALNNLGIEAYYDGDWPKAADLYERSRALRERIGDVVSAAIATNNIAEIFLDQGRLDEAEAMFQEVLVTCEATGQRFVAAAVRMNLGSVAARAGRLDDARTLLGEAEGIFREVDASGFLHECEVRLAELEVLRGDDPDAALDAAEDVLAQAADAADTAVLRAAAHRVRAAALAQLGDRAGALAAIGESAAAARAGGALHQLALALDLEAAIGGDAAAADESRALLEQLGVVAVVRPPLPSS